MLIALAPTLNASTPDSQVIANNPGLSAENVLTTESYTETTKDTSDTTSEKNNPNAGVAEKVNEYFADIPIMAKVAYCESTHRQYNTNGTVLRGKVDNADVGVMQINERYHKKTADKAGYDLHTIEGNMAFARALYNEQGVQPWSASRPCWGKYQ